jgi:hypothetical protein
MGHGRPRRIHRRYGAVRAMRRSGERTRTRVGDGDGVVDRRNEATGCRAVGHRMRNSAVYRPSGTSVAMASSTAGPRAALIGHTVGAGRNHEGEISCASRCERRISSEFLDFPRWPASLASARPCRRDADGQVLGALLTCRRPGMLSLAPRGCDKVIRRAPTLVIRPRGILRRPHRPQVGARRRHRPEPCDPLHLTPGGRRPTGHADGRPSGWRSDPLIGRDRA